MVVQDIRDSLELTDKLHSSQRPGAWTRKSEEERDGEKQRTWSVSSLTI